jgi:hypothetical protein
VLLSSARGLNHRLISDLNPRVDQRQIPRADEPPCASGLPVALTRAIARTVVSARVGFVAGDAGNFRWVEAGVARLRGLRL